MAHSIAGVDFTPETLNDVEFLPTDSNQTETILTVAIVDDPVVEPVELFQVKADVVLEHNVYDTSTSDTLVIGIVDNGDSKERERERERERESSNLAIFIH